MMRRFVTKQLIEEYGYKFECQEYENWFIDFLNDELAMQIGIAISDVLSPRQSIMINEIAENNSENNVELMERFLTEEVPNYLAIVDKEVKSFYRQLKSNRNSVMKKYRTYSNMIVAQEEF